MLQRWQTYVAKFALKILCGNCGTMFLRRTSKNGYVTWVCRTHDRSADACHVGRIPESEIRAAFLRMYRKLKCNADMILKARYGADERP